MDFNQIWHVSVLIQDLSSLFISSVLVVVGWGTLILSIVTNKTSSQVLKVVEPHGIACVYLRGSGF